MVAQSLKLYYNIKTLKTGENGKNIIKGPKPSSFE